MGTVEPIFQETDKENYEKLAFLRGFVEKYKNSEVDEEEIFKYLEDLLADS